MPESLQVPSSLLGLRSSHESKFTALASVIHVLVRRTAVFSPRLIQERNERASSRLHDDHRQSEMMRGKIQCFFTFSWIPHQWVVCSNFLPPNINLEYKIWSSCKKYISKLENRRRRRRCIYFFFPPPLWMIFQYSPFNSWGKGSIRSSKQYEKRI